MVGKIAGLRNLSSKSRARVYFKLLIKTACPVSTVAAQSVRVFVPPFTEVENFVQTQTLIEKLALMNQQAGLASTFDDGFNDLIERHDFVFEIRIEDAQCEKGAGQRTRHGDRYLR